MNCAVAVDETLALRICRDLQHAVQGLDRLTDGGSKRTIAQQSARQPASRAVRRSGRRLVTQAAAGEEIVR